MSSAVFDSSALIALLRREPGWERVAAYLPGALMSTVNFAEVLTRLTDHGTPVGAAVSSIEAMGVTLVDFSAEDAIDTAGLRAATKSHGLSLGDRACLTLSRRRGHPAITADAVWANVPGFDIELIRKRSR